MFHCPGRPGRGLWGAVFRVEVPCSLGRIYSDLQNVVTLTTKASQCKVERSDPWADLSSACSSWLCQGLGNACFPVFVTLKVNMHPWVMDLLLRQKEKLILTSVEPLLQGNACYYDGTSHCRTSHTARSCKQVLFREE